MNFSIRHDCRRHYDRHEMLNCFTSTVNNNTVLENFSVSHISNHTLLQASAQSDRCSCAGSPPLLALNSVSLQQVISRSSINSVVVNIMKGSSRMDFILLILWVLTSQFLYVFMLWHLLWLTQSCLSVFVVCRTSRNSATALAVTVSSLVK